MNVAALVLAQALSPGAPATDAGATPRDPCVLECCQAPFVHDWFFRGLVGAGSVPNLPTDDRTGNMVLTAEVGAHPLQGAFATGFSLSNASDWKGHWSVVTPGLFGQLDLTYLLLSGLWAYQPQRDFPFRLAVGSRLGLGVSESFRPSDGLPADTYAPAYRLLRVELMSFLDLDIPLTADRHYALVARAAVDTPVNVSSVFRWSGSVGISSAWSATP
jgi:hypothetical protein